MMRFAGKTALVTGGGGGIGGAIGLRLAAEGAAIGVLDRRGDAAAAARRGSRPPAAGRWRSRPRSPTRSPSPPRSGR